LVPLPNSFLAARDRSPVPILLSLAASLALHAFALAFLARHSTVDRFTARSELAPALKVRIVRADPEPAPAAAIGTESAVEDAAGGNGAEQSSAPRLLDYAGERDSLLVPVDVAGSLRVRITVSADGRALAVAVEQSSLPEDVVKAVVGDLYRASYLPARVRDRALTSDMLLVVELSAAE
jgi:hypothetical protein